MQVSKTISQYRGDGAYETYKNTVSGLSFLKQDITKIVEEIFMGFGYDRDDVSVHYVDSIILIFAYIDDNVCLNKEVIAALDDFMGISGSIRGGDDFRIEIVYNTKSKSIHQTVFQV